MLSLPLINLDLTPRLTHAAEHDLSIIWNIVAALVLNEQVTDKRISRIDDKELTTSSTYRVLWVNHPVDQFAPAIWKNYAPNKCRIFLWLAHKGMLYTNERRFRRGIAASADCPFCSSVESTNHMLSLAFRSLRYGLS